MTYVVESKTEDVDIIALQDLKTFLRISCNSTSEDDLLRMLINSAVNRAEKYMNRNLLITTWNNYRDSINEDLTLRRGAFNAVSKIEYLKNSVYTLLATTEYDVSIGGAFGVIKNITPPTDNDIGVANIYKITFTTGYGAEADDIPEDIKIGIMQDVSFLYSNRGDCSNVKMSIPESALSIYKGYRLIDTVGERPLDTSI